MSAKPLQIYERREQWDEDNLLVILMELGGLLQPVTQAAAAEAITHLANNLSSFHRGCFIRISYILRYNTQHLHNTT